MKNNRREIYRGLAKNLNNIADALEDWGHTHEPISKKLYSDVKYMRGVATSLELKACSSG
jgi:hypothetical protein